MARSEKAVVTVLCMVHDGTRLLLQNRVKADWRGYTLPGGHVEKGESFVQAVTREMREETGLTVHAPRLCGISSSRRTRTSGISFCCSKQTVFPARCVHRRRARWCGWSGTRWTLIRW